MKIKKAKELAEEFGGKCLSEIEDFKFLTPLLWECSEGHQWKDKWKNIIERSKRSNALCKICFKNKDKQLRAEKQFKIVTNLAKKNGGECLSKIEHYKSNCSRFLFRCKNNHKWRTQIASIKAGSWCSFCAGNSILTLEIPKALAAERGGLCLSETYKNARELLTWQCKFGHIWEARYYNIKTGRWCPTCSTGSYERITRAYLEAIFEKPFPKARPDWLKGNHKNLELDGYCAELNIAFEYNGTQHYMPISKTKFSRFKQLKIYDKKKQQICKQLGIKLIVIKETIQNPNIKDIRRQIEKVAKKFNVPMKEIDINEIRFNTDRLKPYSDIAVSKGGKCLSSNYVDAHFKLDWQCKEGHIWKASANGIKNGNWCKKCSTKNLSNKRKYDNLNDGNL